MYKIRGYPITIFPTVWIVNQMRNYMPPTTSAHKSIPNNRKKSENNHWAKSFIHGGFKVFGNLPFAP